MPAPYSLNWARRVVWQVQKKYPRATDKLFELLDIDSDDLAHYLATADPLWPNLRLLVHVLDNWHEKCSEAQFEGLGRQDLRQYVAIHHWNRILSRLDELEKSARMEEQA